MYLKNQIGFTLIEIVVTLLLVGITAAMAGLWIVSVANGYVFIKLNMETTQKAQLVITRLEKEFKTMTAIEASSEESITYTRTNYDYEHNRPGAPLAGQKVMVLPDSKTLKLNDDVLSDNVEVFTLSYCDDMNSNSCFTSWQPTSRIIEITLTMSGAGGEKSVFTQRVAPRNL
jgi:prepilin-type N-terminal cleavage/methylation domain-containing protein